MRHHLGVLLCVTSWLLMGLGGCAGDSMKSSQRVAEDRSTPAVAQTEGAQGEPPSGEIQERAVPLPLPRPGPSGPLQFAPPPLYVGPTQNITVVANALAQYHKSLTTLTTVKPGLVLTQPVTISIAYLSPAGYGPNSPERLTQTYVPATGNHFLRNDNTGNGQPRRVHLDINLSEPKPGGGLYSYNVPMDLDLDPLYDVAISPLNFQLIYGCAFAGSNIIKLRWYPPDQARFYETDFNAVNGERFTINEFAWARSEVSAAANFRKVSVWYDEFQQADALSFGPPGFAEFAPPRPTDNLIPGTTYTSNPALVKALNNDECSATLNYTVTYTLRWYPCLGP